MTTMMTTRFMRSGLAIALGAVACGDPARARAPWSGYQYGDEPDDPPASTDASAGESESTGSDETPPNAPIFGGTVVNTCGWPSTVALVSGGGSCTGTLVHPQIVAYAAHCGTGFSAVRFGERSSGSGLRRTVPTNLCRTFPGGGPGNGRDFAFCRLAQPVNDVPIVPILMGCETEVLAPGLDVTVVGFGVSETSGYGIKREVDTVLNGITADDEASVGGGGEDSCQGDSGGPVFTRLADGSWRVFGVTSYGGACGSGGFYSILHNGVEFIESQSGIDVTPCHDVDGTWNPGPGCLGFPLDPAVGGGSWTAGCSGGPASGPSSTCGPALGGGDDGAADDGGNDDGAAGDGGDGGTPDDLVSCVDRCGAQAPGGCWCDTQCTQFGDCCADQATACAPPSPTSCVGRCGRQAPGGCWCDAQCAQFGDCCQNKLSICGAG